MKMESMIAIIKQDVKELLQLLFSCSSVFFSSTCNESKFRCAASSVLSSTCLRVLVLRDLYTLNFLIKSTTLPTGEAHRWRRRQIHDALVVVRPTLFCARRLVCTSIELAFKAPTSSSNCSVKTCCASFSLATLFSSPPSTLSPLPFPFFDFPACPDKKLPSCLSQHGVVRVPWTVSEVISGPVTAECFVLILGLSLLPFRAPEAWNRRNSCCRSIRQRSNPSTRKLNSCNVFGATTTPKSRLCNSASCSRKARRNCQGG